MKKPTMKNVEKSKADKAKDKKMGYKENSKEDKALDKKELMKMKKEYNKKRK
jgi:hypothetical protein